jgi:hypothetical protein
MLAGLKPSTSVQACYKHHVGRVALARRLARANQLQL